MTKRSGLGQQLYVGGYDLSGDANALNNVSGGPALLDFTGIDKSSPERLPGQRSGGLSVMTFFNTAAGKAHPVLKTLPRTDVVSIYGMSSTLGDDAFCMVAKQVNYDPNRAADGSFIFTTEMQSNSYGSEWCLLCTAGLKTASAAVTGVGVSFATPAVTGTGSNGLQAYLEVTAFNGSSLDIKLQHSTDDGGTDPYADISGAAFTTVSAAPAAERIAVTGTVKKWIRYVASGTFTSATFVVAVDRNESAVSF